MQVYINRDGQQYGPYTIEEVRAHLASGAVLVTDQAWREGMAHWMPVSQFQEVLTPGPTPSQQAVMSSELEEKIICEFTRQLIAVKGRYGEIVRADIVLKQNINQVCGQFLQRIKKDVIIGQLTAEGMDFVAVTTFVDFCEQRLGKNPKLRTRILAKQRKCRNSFLAGYSAIAAGTTIMVIGTYYWFLLKTMTFLIFGVILFVSLSLLFGGYWILTKPKNENLVETDGEIDFEGLAQLLELLDELG